MLRHCRYKRSDTPVRGTWSDRIAAVDASSSDLEIRADKFAALVLEGLGDGALSRGQAVSSA